MIWLMRRVLSCFRVSIGARASSDARIMTRGMDAAGGAIGASGPMLARQKRWAAAFSLPFRKTGVGGWRERTICGAPGSAVAG